MATSVSVDSRGAIASSETKTAASSSSQVLRNRLRTTTDLRKAFDFDQKPLSGLVLNFSHHCYSYPF
ncbi:unnamed protein product [Angiostrongylus costaricensis]|uniref:Uncharacterized protein n=1 Tax=Angiostrongylus costaricensis TaxID=334426 RepID=A0A0R3PNV5_ANGCS|nr:unnamed protein product [Angiostrongylus costaricensis]